MGFPWVYWSLFASFVNSRERGSVVVMSWVKLPVLQDKGVSQKLLLSLSVVWSTPFAGGKSCTSSLLHLHPYLGRATMPCSLGGRFTSFCWRLVSLSLSLWLSGRRAVSKGSHTSSCSGCAGEHWIALLVPRSVRADMKDASLLCWSGCYFTALWRAVMVWWGWLPTRWVRTLAALW